MYSLSPLTSANFQFLDSGRERALCVAEQDHQGWAVLALFYLDNLDILIFVHSGTSQQKAVPQMSQMQLNGHWMDHMTVTQMMEVE